MAPTIAQCNAQELECEHSYGTTQRILIYETRTDTGLAEALFMQMFDTLTNYPVLTDNSSDELLSRAILLMQQCGCVEGCLACVVDSRCRYDHASHNKAMAPKV